MTYKLGSLFDGSGGFPLAGSLCGIDPSWASEVEPYPIAVTRERFPSMKHLGDISKINGAEIEPVDIITFGSPCFPAGTLVLTKEGYKEIENIHIGELVYTHAGNWKPVSAVGYKYSPTVKLKGNHYGIIATPNHPFYSAECERLWNGNGYDTELKNVGEWTPAAKMAGKRWAVPIQLSGLDIPKIETQNNKQNEPPVIDDRLMYVIGRWLGDGWLRDGQRPNRASGQTFGQIFICANNEKSPYLQKILNDVFTGSSAVKLFQERTVNKFRINNQALCKWLKQNFGEKAHGKTLPAWALCMNEEMRKALLFGYLDSDGYKIGENSFKATTVSKKLAHSLRLLGESLGYSCTVHYANVPSKTIIEGRTVNQKPQYQVVLRGTERKTGIITDTHKWYKCRTVEPYSDKQTVYNITVDDDHSYIVEGFVVHNCQDLSVAGKRAGLKHEANGDEETTRSGLFMEAVRIIKEMRTATNGKYPRFALWENVPGAFSSNKGEDFRIVCEELIKIVEPSALMPEVPKNGWPYSDSYVGDGWSLAYRVFDAQYWGVPQRRRRIHLIADFRGECAREILFKRDGVRGYFTESGTPWQTAAADTEGSTGATDREGEAKSTISLASVAATLRAGAGAPKHEQDFVGRLVLEKQEKTERDNIILDDQGGQQITVRSDGKVPTLRAETHGNLPCVLEAIGFDAYNHVTTGSKAKTLTAKRSDTDHTPVVFVPNDAPVYSIENHPADSRVKIDESGKCQCLTSRMGTGGGNVPMVMEPISGANFIDVEMEVAVRKYEVNTELLCECLREHKATTGLNNKEIAERLNRPVTEVEHWFRTDKCFSIPAPDVWFKLKELLNIETTEFDKGVTEFEFKGGNYDMRNRIHVGDVSPTLTCGSGNDLHLLPVGPVYCLQGNGIDRADTAGCNGKGWNDKVCYTLNTIDRPAVAYSINHQGGNVEQIIEGKTGILTAAMNTSGNNKLSVCYCSDVGLLNTYENVAAPLLARQYKDPHTVCYRQGGFAEYIEGEVRTLRASGGDFGGGSENLIVQNHKYIVRRLTPTECARLQGFADWWGHIEQKTEFTDEEYRFWLEVRNTHAAINDKPVKEYTKAQMLTWYNKLYTDSAEYKMWGNGIALPPALYCMQGVIDALVEATEEKEELNAELVDDQNRQHSEAVCSVMDFITEEPSAKIEELPADEPTDLSDAPEEIKAEIIKNDELLQVKINDISEDKTMETPVNNIENNTESMIPFSAVEQLRQLANERKALANLKPDNTRFSDDVRALEYAVSVLEAVGL